MVTEIYIYFLLNMFFAGYYLSDNYRWASDLQEKVKVIFFTLCMSLFGVTYILVSIFIAIFELVFEWINIQTNITFWIQFYFTKKWNNLDEGVLERINKFAYKHRLSDKFKDKVYRLSVKKMNERNNYTYIDKSDLG